MHKEFRQGLFNFGRAVIRSCTIRCCWAVWNQALLILQIFSLQKPHCTTTAMYNGCVKAKENMHPLLCLERTNNSPSHLDRACALCLVNRGSSYTKASEQNPNRKERGFHSNLRHWEDSYTLVWIGCFPSVLRNFPSHNYQNCHLVVIYLCLCLLCLLKLSQARCTSGFTFTQSTCFKLKS